MDIIPNMTAPIRNLLMDWKDDNHAHITDTETGHKFDLTVRPKTTVFIAGKRVKPRLYINGMSEKERELGRNGFISFAKEYFGSPLKKILGPDVTLRFSWKAGCSCGCSPGFILENCPPIGWDFWLDAQ